MSASPASSDTIVAVATAPGRGAVGILRISGPRAAEIAEKIAGPLPRPRYAALRDLRDAAGELLDRGLLLWFPAPASFTGEAVVELQAHGGPVLLDALVQAACACGARPARPGEFSERAFVNGRLDLAQAEAIADLIDAGSRAAARAATRTLSGEFSRQIDAMVESLIVLRADLEAALDFADEDVPWLSSETLGARIEAVQEGLARVSGAAARGQRLREGLTVAIAGAPNVGKSSLLNRLAGADIAIVSPIAGTTRDLLREDIVIDGLPLTVVDTAGLRDTQDPVEREGVARARAAIQRAELVLLLVDDRESGEPEHPGFDPGAARLLRVRNKCDLSGKPAQRVETAAGVEIRLSARSGEGIEELRKELKAIAGYDDSAGETLGARTRHLEALRAAGGRLVAARVLAGTASQPELVAEELRLAQQDLEAITGRFSSEDLLGRIFAQFCLGK